MDIWSWCVGMDDARAEGYEPITRKKQLRFENDTESWENHDDEKDHRNDNNDGGMLLLKQDTGIKRGIWKCGWN